MHGLMRENTKKNLPLSFFGGWHLSISPKSIRIRITLIITRTMRKQKMALEHRTEQNTKTFLTPEHRTENEKKLDPRTRNRTEHIIEKS